MYKFTFFFFLQVIPWKFLHSFHLFKGLLLACLVWNQQERKKSRAIFKKVSLKESEIVLFEFDVYKWSFIFYFCFRVGGLQVVSMAYGPTFLDTSFYPSKGHHLELRILKRLCKSQDRLLFAIYFLFHAPYTYIIIFPFASYHFHGSI